MLLSMLPDGSRDIEPGKWRLGTNVVGRETAVNLKAIC